MKTRFDAVGAPIPPEWMPDPDDRAAVAREEKRAETVDSLLPRTVASKALREAAAATPHGWCYASRDWRGRYELVAPGDVDTRRQKERIYRVRVHPDRVPQWTDTDRRLEMARRARLARTSTASAACIYYWSCGRWMCVPARKDAGVLEARYQRMGFPARRGYTTESPTGEPTPADWAAVEAAI